MNNTAEYQLPGVSDYEGDSFKVTLYSPTGSFVTYDPVANKLTFTPTEDSDIGLQTVMMRLTDTDSSDLESFQIKILNTPPVYDDSSFTGYSDISVRLS